jgi:ADP-ribose pyrophosphatase YjhB (NUDIX family)
MIIVAVGVVVLHENAVLLIKRSQPPLEDMWSLPGGRVEMGETMRAAAQREVFEETGLSIALQELVDAVDLIEPGGNGRIERQFALIDYWAEVVSGTLRAGDDASHADWWPLEALPGLGLWPETARVIAQAVSRRDQRLYQQGMGAL